jgi:Na+-driven multidrug efflux pump
MILNGNIYKTILVIALPILFYNVCNYFYGIYDMMIVEVANIGDAADVVVLDQIKNMIQTLGGAIATGGGILIARKIGENDINGARVSSNTLFTMALIIAGLTLLFIPLAVPFLELLKTDKTTIENALGYFDVQMINLFIMTLNVVFIAIEKSKGNTLRIFVLNIGVIIIKIGLTTLFAFGPFKNVTITWLAIATMIAQSFMMIVMIFLSISKTNILRLTPKQLNLKKQYVLSIIKLSLPVFIGRFLFHFGKVYLNSIATVTYGKQVVGALGISNTMAGLPTNMINSFEDGGSTIVGQNYGNGNGKRIKQFYIVNMIMVATMSLIAVITLFLLKSNVASFFSGDDLEYRKIIVEIFKWEILDVFFTGIAGASNAIFYGFGKTRITSIMSMVNLFAFRLPTIMFLMYVVKMNYEACGIAMFVSNTLAGIITFTLCLIFMIKMPKNKKYESLFSNKELTIN